MIGLFTAFIGQLVMLLLEILFLCVVLVGISVVVKEIRKAMRRNRR